MKPIIYQLIPRLFTNYSEAPVVNGTIEQNSSGKLNSINKTILKEIKKMGVTHVWYTGVIEHAHDADYTAYGIPRDNPYVVKGHAGSPYAISDYYDIDPDLAESVPDRLAEFDALVKRTHEAGLKVIIDFVPNHVARQYCSDAKPRGIRDLGDSDNQDMFFSPSNNFYYITRQQFRPVDVYLGHGSDAYSEFPAKASGNDCYTAFPGRNDWYDTAKLNYGVDPWNGSKCFDPIPATWFKMLHILRYWSARGVDGFRCDMAHMVPLEFWRWALDNLRTKYPNVIFIAEIYDVGLYRPFIEAGFDYLYDKVNLYDTLFGIDRNHVSAAKLTSCWQTVEGIGEHMLNFLENHDEVRYASRFFGGDPRRIVPSLVVSAFINKGPLMVYAGQELGEDAAGVAGYSGDDGRTTIFDYWIVPTLQQWLNHGDCQGKLTEQQEQLRHFYVTLMKLCNKEKAISEGDFFDLMYVNYTNGHFNPHRQFAFMRHHDNTLLVIAVNYSFETEQLQINIPQLAFDMYGIAPGKYRATEMLSGETTIKPLDPSVQFPMTVAGHGAAIWHIKYKKNREAEGKK